MSETFHVVLRDVDGFEGLESRSFELLVGGASFPIGRASKNTSKKVLMPAAHNAYIDSPVISREHALLSAEATVEGPQVFVTDTGSMHGTVVNGERLVAHTPKQLRSGDMLQFGIDVNRNEEFFVARKYTFESKLAQHAAYSLGFTVPDSEGEVADMEPRRGSQSDPLVLEDSDSESDVSDDEDRQVTMIADSLASDSDHDDDEEPLSAADSGLPSVHDMISIMADYSENDDIENYSSDVQDDLDSVASVMGESEAGYDSDVDIAETKPENLSSLDNAIPVHVYGYGRPDLSYPSQELFSQSGSWHSAPPNAGSELPPFGFTLPPPLPPRPAAPHSAMFNCATIQSSSSATTQSGSEFQPYGNQAPIGFLGTNHGDRPSLFSPAPFTMSSGQGSHADQPIETSDVGGSSFPPLAMADRIQTPPLMPASDVMTPTPPPNRRTKVSITEIVEDQPPTPSSVNGTKRKADVLDDTESYISAEPIALGETAQPIVLNTSAQTAAIIAQRPKKQPRSILNKVATTAKYFGIGAFSTVSAVALLSSLPDAFFGA